MIESVLSGVISPVISGVIVGGAQCSLYFFDPANSDPLDIPSTTGDVTIVYATFNGLTGLASDFVVVPTDSPVGAIDNFDLLVWNTETVAVTALVQLADSTFDGVFAYFVLDGVTYIVDQGSVAINYLYSSDGFLLKSSDNIILEAS